MAISLGHSIQLRASAIVLCPNSLSNSKDSVSSLLVLPVPFWFHSAMEIPCLHMYVWSLPTWKMLGCISEPESGAL